MRQVRFLAPAETEARRAALFYEDAAPGQGAAFRASLQRSLDAIRQHPELGKTVEAGFRSVSFDRFPFKLIYRVERAAIVVVAVAHDRRQPGYWR